MPKGKKRTDMDLILEAKIRRKVERASMKMIEAANNSVAKTPWEGMRQRYEGTNPKR